MSQTSPRLDLPYVMPAQARKHVTVNEAIRRLDALVQISVRSRTAENPPGAPGEGEAWIVPGDPWDGFAPGEVAAFQDGSWARLASKPGWLAWCEDEAVLLVNDGQGWRNALSLNDLDRLGVGTGADEANPFAAKLNSALWTARETGEGGTGDLRYAMNKQGEAQTASLILQSGWQGRAEMGLAGEDDFSIKVSADGQDWTEALRIDRATGAVSAQGAGLIHRGNMVGETGFDDGLPGGAVIERGSTPEGEYVRFADGTQICVTGVIDFGLLTAGGSGTYADPWRTDQPVSVVWPRPFIAPPAASASLWLDQGAVLASARAVILSAAVAPTPAQWPTLRCVRLSGNDHPTRALGRITAVGRWA